MTKHSVRSAKIGYAQRGERWLPQRHQLRVVRVSVAWLLILTVPWSLYSRECQSTNALATFSAFGTSGESESRRVRFF